MSKTYIYWQILQMRIIVKPEEVLPLCEQLK